MHSRILKGRKNLQIHHRPGLAKLGDSIFDGFCLCIWLEIAEINLQKNIRKEQLVYMHVKKPINPNDPMHKSKGSHCVPLYLHSSCTYNLMLGVIRAGFCREPIKAVKKEHSIYAERGHSKQ